ncbi:hypothetical protein SLS62_008636 [Diatrype stigma]|uniref:Major facilitator superfamily (MFS) profile domain-containing protein n=1 Tax=Diatrype stigma TaxID=117547 RepID=A0AAN9UTR0_9PEZI
MATTTETPDKPQLEGSATVCELEKDGNGNGNAATPTQDVSTPPYSVFTPSQGRLIVFMTALAGFFSPFSAFIYFPAVNYISADLHVSVQLVNITITAYLLVQGVVPAFFGDLADQIGRRPVYLLVLSVYFVSCIGLAVQRSYPALLVLRMLQSAGSSGEMAR